MRPDGNTRPGDGNVAGPFPLPAGRRLHVLLPALGSAGDVHPMLALGLALEARGHRATIVTNPLFEALIDGHGLGFLPVGTRAAAEALIAHPDLWHPRRGFRLLCREVIGPATAEVYRHLERHAGDDTIVAASGIAFGARLAQERLGLPLATVHLQPAMIRSLVDMGMAPNFRIAAAQPAWFKRGFFRLVDAVIDRYLVAALNDFRATLALAPVTRPFRRWVHSPECVLGFFPDWFAAPQPDWPPNVHLVGFPLWDGGENPLPPEAEAFLAAGEPPIVFTPGSARAAMGAFFRESLAALRTVGRRAMLVTNYPAQLPPRLPAGTQAFGYLPFSRLLPRAALLVHHGGIGTLAQAVKAGIPQLVVPSAHDQFDNGWRVERLGLGRMIRERDYRARGAANALAELLGSDAGGRAIARARAIDPALALSRACRHIEALARRPPARGPG